MGKRPDIQAGLSIRLKAICLRLRKLYGPVQLTDRLPPLDELIATILSQNTNDANSDAAFDELRRRYPDWDAVRRASVTSIARAIRTAGLSQQKAPRIKNVLNRLHRERGELSLDFLSDLPVEEAIEYLRSFPGVGPKTAACVLLFACNQPVLPVDTHVHRVSRRLGLIAERTTAEKAHADLAKLVPRAGVLDFHVHLVWHGRRICKAQRPKCKECVLLKYCPTGPQLIYQRKTG